MIFDVLHKDSFVLVSRISILENLQNLLKQKTIVFYFIKFRLFFNFFYVQDNIIVLFMFESSCKVI